MKNRQDKVTHLDPVKFPRANKDKDGKYISGANNYVYGHTNHSKHPYMRKDFVFKCCSKNE